MQCIGYELCTNNNICYMLCAPFTSKLYVVSAYRSQSFTSSFTNYIKAQDAWGSPGVYDKWKLTLGGGVTFTVCDISALLVVCEISVTLVVGDISAALAVFEILVMLAVGDISATFVLWDTLGNVSYENKHKNRSISDYW